MVAPTGAVAVSPDPIQGWSAQLQTAAPTVTVKGTSTAVYAVYSPFVILNFNEWAAWSSVPVGLDGLTEML